MQSTWCINLVFSTHTLPSYLWRIADYVELRVGMMAGDESDRHADLGKEIHALSSASKPYAAFFARGMPGL